MKNTIRIAAALLGAVAVSLLTIAPTNASGSSGLSQCRYDGWVNGFADSSDTDFDPFADLSLENRFETYICYVQGMRLHKIHADTTAERHELSIFTAGIDDLAYPSVLCDNGKRSVVIQLEIVWTDKAISRWERTHYRTWAKKHASKHDCRIFN